MKPIPFVLVVAACARQDKTTLTSATLDATAGDDSVVEMAQRWNRALALRDPTLVTRAYGTRVTLFGVPLRNDQVVHVMTHAIDGDPSFSQTIHDVRVQGAHVVLTREWIRFGKSHTGQAWLDGTREGNRWVVTGQGDDASDARLRRGQHDAPFCEQLALRIALSTKRATALVDGPPGHVHAFVAASPPDFPAYAVALTTEAAGVPTTVGWYDVVPCFLYAPGPAAQTLAAVCVTPGDVAGAVTDGLSGSVLGADPKMIVEMSQCND